jgi:deazaflavin-dependent oxidoreductase (nitroreductase family)
MTVNGRPRWWHPVARSYASSRFATFVNRYALPPIDRMVMRLSGGATSLSALSTGLPVIVLTTTGARSGKKRTTPLVAMPDGRKLVLIASNWGQERNPAWYYNLRANPCASVEIAGQSRTYVSREATPKEYDKLWRRASRFYPVYEKYKEWSQGRHIPIVVLTPQEERPAGEHPK